MAASTISCHKRLSEQLVILSWQVTVNVFAVDAILPEQQRWCPSWWPRPLRTHYSTLRLQMCGVHINECSGAYDSSRCENVQIIILMSTSDLMNLILIYDERSYRVNYDFISMSIGWNSRNQSRCTFFTFIGITEELTQTEFLKKTSRENAVSPRNRIYMNYIVHLNCREPYLHLKHILCNLCSFDPTNVIQCGSLDRICAESVYEI